MTNIAAPHSLRCDNAKAMMLMMMFVHSFRAYPAISVA